MMDDARECIHDNPRGPFKCPECRRMTAHGADPFRLYARPAPSEHVDYWADRMRQAAGLAPKLPELPL